ncbi:hypothetical protein CW362_30445 [Streptomyces populi]|uniref:Uncharacterized protein n=1 Tax=Streptomyces populi TaxID=2058924 RepID=A0A2I0SH41_9ACTN|nr:hypothetical protein CW362_30445 [Streptomyces populi]
MADRRRTFDAGFREGGSVRIITETKPTARGAKDFGIDGTAPASWLLRACGVDGKPPAESGRVIRETRVRTDQGDRAA